VGLAAPQEEQGGQGSAGGYKDKPQTRSPGQGEWCLTLIFVGVSSHGVSERCWCVKGRVQGGARGHPEKPRDWGAGQGKCIAVLSVGQPVEQCLCKRSGGTDVLGSVKTSYSSRVQGQVSALQCCLRQTAAAECSSSACVTDQAVRRCWAVSRRQPRGRGLGPGRSL
jgi:hypothetical protein